MVEVGIYEGTRIELGMTWVDVGVEASMLVIWVMCLGLIEQNFYLINMALCVEMTQFLSPASTGWASRVALSADHGDKPFIDIFGQQLVKSRASFNQPTSCFSCILFPCTYFRSWRFQSTQSLLTLFTAGPSVHAGWTIRWRSGPSVSSSDHPRYAGQWP